MQRMARILTTLTLAQLVACDPAGPDDHDDADELVVDDPLQLALDTEIDVEPATHEDALRSLAQIDARLDDDPEDVDALAARAAIQPRLDELNGLVARVEPSPGHVVSFYEPLPGVIGISESAPLGALRMLGTADVESLPVVDLYLRVAGGDAVVPEALLAAQAHANEAAGASPGTDVQPDLPPMSLAAPDDGAVEPLTSADGPWWTNNVCYGSEADAKWCLPNWGGGAWAAKYSKTSASAVGPYSGNVTIRAQRNGATVFTENVLQGFWREAWMNSPWDWDCGIFACSDWDYDVTHHRWDILNASGNSFHWAAGFNWSCYGSDWDCPWRL